MAYASIADLMLRFDTRTLGQLASDSNQPLAEANLADSAILSAALDDASGEIEVAIRAGDRYSAADLAALTGNSLNHLKRICCDIAIGLLFDRRSFGAKSDLRGPAMDLAQQHLNSLRRGDTIFNIQANHDAAVPDEVGPTVVEMRNQGLLVTRIRNFFPPLRLPQGRQ